VSPNTARPTVRVGVIGVGNIGQEHIRTLTRVVPGAQVVAVSDVDAARAETVAGQLTGARVFANGQALIRADEVDAVLVASWGPSHAEFVVAAIEAGKPVFCEKPLAPTTDECQHIMEAEIGCGRHLVQVGFMRRYDDAYRALKRTLGKAGIGSALIVHCAHRNPDVPAHYSGDMPITDTAIHEIDLVRWLLDQEIAAARVLQPRRTLRGQANLPDPLLIILEMADGAIVDLETFVTLPYGYDIRCEVVCELGTAALGDGSPVVLRKDGLRSDHVPNDFQERFGPAYQTELHEWVDSVRVGDATGPSAWDGYAATAVADTCIAALHTGERVPVQLRERPAFYRQAPRSAG
jgi:myo-inositol 2-dehydrogenase/D-chiro-inositol 1-dehydrogenase